MVLANVSTGGTQSRGLAVTPDGNFVYVANLDNSNVSVIRASDNMVVGTVTVEAEPHGVAVTPDGDFVYVTNANSDTVSVIRTSDNMVVDTVNAGVGPVSLGLFIGPAPVTLDTMLSGSGVGNVSAPDIDCGDEVELTVRSRISSSARW